MNEAILQLDRFGVAFANTTILHDITYSFPDKGVVVLVGPSGTGKSTLLRTLSGLNDASPSLRTTGTAMFRGHPIGQAGQPLIVTQKTRLMMATVRENLVSDLPNRGDLTILQQREVARELLREAGLDFFADRLDERVVDLPLGTQRLLAMVRTFAAEPDMILLDEPTSGITDEDAEQTLAFMKKQAENRSVLTVVHNQGHARALGGRCALLAGGTIVEDQPTELFFKQPQHRLAMDFVRSGTCCAPAPSTPRENLDPEFTARDTSDPAPAPVTRPWVDPGIPRAPSEHFGPRKFMWLIKGELAGMPRPGLIVDLELDLDALKRVGVTTLVSLESEVNPVPEATLWSFGIQGTSFPIDDMSVPDPADAYHFCHDLHRRTTGGEVVAIHCKAGMGRTGTMLAAYLIFSGYRAMDALEQVRKIEPRWVQSSEQIEFLSRFEAFMLSDMSSPGDIAENRATDVNHETQGG